MPARPEPNVAPTPLNSTREVPPEINPTDDAAAAATADQGASLLSMFWTRISS